MDSTIVFVAKYFLYLSLLVTAWYWWRSTRSTKVELVGRLVVGGVIALALARLGASLYYDPRPFVTEHVRPLFPHAADNGFPSDHALLTSFLGFTLLRFSRRVGAVLLVLAVLVGAARVAAHVHSPIDIIGSFVFSALAVLVVDRAWPFVRRSKWGRRILRG